MFNEYDVVVLSHDIPSETLTTGAKGTILVVHNDPSRAYEIEFLDSDGVTVALLTLTDDDIERIVDH